MTPARIIGGTYAVGRPLGAGSAGSVYEARDLGTGERVAIKLLPRALGRVASIRERFLAEGRHASRIAHANVVRVLDSGMLPDGGCYLVMERLDGDTLEQLLSERSTLPVREACALMLQVLAGLSAAHRNGVVHRDLKPANIMVTYPSAATPHIKVLDFGIAQGLAPGELGRSPRGALLGTPAYMAPEQALGRTVDASADVYAVGVILYELVCGEPAFEGTLAQHVVSRVVCGDFVPLRERKPGLPEELLAIVDAAMITDPEQRISSDALALALARLATPAADRSLAPIRLSRTELEHPRFPRSPLAPRDLVALELTPIAPSPATPTELESRRAATLPARASRASERLVRRAALFVTAAGFAAAMLLSWASGAF